jgi:DNA polymerase III delta prime subunit
MNDETIWAEKYRPKSIKDVLLTDDIREMFEGFIEDKRPPNLIMWGRPGLGKTSSGIALLNDLDADWIKINGSKERNIDTVRTRMHDHASHKSIRQRPKFVLIDEADKLNIQSAQPAMRALMEDYSSNCRFILTCNDISGLDPAILSRNMVIHFSLRRSDLKRHGKLVIKRIAKILKAEGIEYDAEVLARFVNLHWPDMRRMLNELQGYAQRSQKIIDVGILKLAADEDFIPLWKALKARNFKDMRNWVGENLTSMAPMQFARQLWDGASLYMEDDSVPTLVTLLGQFQSELPAVIDIEIHAMAYLWTISNECTFK